MTTFAHPAQIALGNAKRVIINSACKTAAAVAVVGRISMPLPHWSWASPTWAGSATMITGSKAAIARATVA